jgi:hypothetical protein
MKCLRPNYESTDIPNLQPVMQSIMQTIMQCILKSIMLSCKLVQFYNESILIYSGRLQEITHLGGDNYGCLRYERATISIVSGKDLMA